MLASTATAAASDKPAEVPVIWDEVARRQVEDVPIPPVDPRVLDPTHFSLKYNHHHSRRAQPVKRLLLLWLFLRN